MSATKKIKQSEEIIGMGTSAKEWTQEEFDLVSEHIQTRYEKQSLEEKIENQFISIRFQFESYLTQNESDIKITAGGFLKKFIKATGSKNKTFAKYIGLEESNLSSIISGRRKINLDFALKLEQIFEVPANWWLELQLKNEFKNLSKKRKSKNGKYSLKGLLKKVG